MRNSKGQFVDGTAGLQHRFQPGNRPWNKGVTGYMGANRTSFRTGNIPPQRHPKGTVTRLLNKGKPEYTINIDWQGNRKPKNSYKWYLWEVAHQRDRPAGHVLWIKNGDPDDIGVDNLELISRAELARRNR